MNSWEYKGLKDLLNPLTNLLMWERCLCFYLSPLPQSQYSPPPCLVDQLVLLYQVLDLDQLVVLYQVLLHRPALRNLVRQNAQEAVVWCLLYPCLDSWNNLQSLFFSGQQYSLILKVNFADISVTSNSWPINSMVAIEYFSQENLVLSFNSFSFLSFHLDIV